MPDTHAKPDSRVLTPAAAGRGHRLPLAPGPVDASAYPGWRSVPQPQSIPDRYEARENEDGRYVVCDEAPRMRVSIHTANSFSESEARELGERVILLDGAGQFGPLLDNRARLYNLDHHQGCERTFTLATCEQALLLVHSGLDLSEGDWTVYANEPDLDTVLAIWCLINYQRITTLSPEARDVLAPLIRLEGAIDSNGTELAAVCGLPRYALAGAQRHIDGLLAPEKALREAGEWLKGDLLEFVVEQLAAIDRIVYEASDFLEYRRIDQIYGHAELRGGWVAVACRDAGGIYEVEQHLKARWGDQLGLIALEKDSGHYTLRRTSSLSDIDLDAAYELLNTLDPQVDGRPASKRWGGSNIIGGSPRDIGSGLGAMEILRTLQLAFEERSFVALARRIGWLTLFTATLAACAGVAGLAWNWVPGSIERGLLEPVRVATFAGIATLLCWPLARWLSGRRTWLYGWRRPAGRDWLGLAPLVVLAAVPLRAWVPQEATLDPRYLAAAVGAIALGALATEFWFRGVAHGVLLLDSRLQHVEGPWHLSRAALVSTALYAVVTLGASAMWILASPAPLVSMAEEMAIVALAATVGGLALATIRERSLSLWPGVGLQLMGGLASLGFWYWLGTDPFLPF